MRLAPDKILHLQFGTAIAVALMGLFYLSHSIGIPGSVLLGSIAAGIGYEVQQFIRKEGEATWQDAFATAAPGGLLALLLYVLA